MAMWTLGWIELLILAFVGLVVLGGLVGGVVALVVWSQRRDRATGDKRQQ